MPYASISIRFSILNQIAQFKLWRAKLILFFYYFLEYFLCFFLSVRPFECFIFFCFIDSILFILFFWFWFDGTHSTSQQWKRVIWNHSIEKESSAGHSLSCTERILMKMEMTSNHTKRLKSNGEKEAVVMVVVSVVVLKQWVTNGMAIVQLVEGSRETVGLQLECTNTLNRICFNLEEYYLCICNYVCYNKSKHEKKLIINHIYNL